MSSSNEFIRYYEGRSSEFREAISLERGERPEMIAVPFAEDVDPTPAAQSKHRPSGLKTRRDFQRPAFGVSNKPLVAAAERRHVEQRHRKFFEPGMGRHGAREGFRRLTAARPPRTPCART